MSLCNIYLKHAVYCPSDRFSGRGDNGRPQTQGGDQPEASAAEEEEEDNEEEVLGDEGEHVEPREELDGSGSESESESEEEEEVGLALRPPAPPPGKLSFALPLPTRLFRGFAHPLISLPISSLPLSYRSQTTKQA